MAASDRTFVRHVMTVGDWTTRVDRIVVREAQPDIVHITTDALLELLEQAGYQEEVRDGQGQAEAAGDGAAG